VGDLAIVLIVILVLVVIWRGPKTLPRLGEALGRGVREARQQATRDDPGGPADPGATPPADGDRRP
jgi:Sec-independent protein translocase protein TatA